LLTQAVEEKTASNADMKYEIEHINDPQTIENIARVKLGLLRPGEKVFYRVSD
jgi:cell division protein FtsB